MIRPLDSQVAFNSLPDHAARVRQESAALEYRRIQEFGEARQENLVRPQQVVEIAQSQAALPRLVERSGEGARVAESRERTRRRQSDERDADLDRLTYRPGGTSLTRRRYSEFGAGLHFDLSA